MSSSNRRCLAGICRTHALKSIATVLLVFVVLGAPNVFAGYLWPLPFGNELSSGYGDWRTRHYHAGLDVRTGGTTGLPVVAPADGYIMRISMSYYGYGKALYLKMDDGNVAVFGHLDRFRPEVDDYVARQQIATESYSQNLIFDTPIFRYQRGDTICYAGKTGVGAPHLHFEIRTADNKTLNPLAFDGLKVDDKQAPEIRRLRLIGKWNDELQRALGRKLDYTFLKKPGQKAFSLNAAIECDSEPFWLAVEAFDRIGTNTWLKPIYSLELTQGDQQLYHLTYDTISFDDTYLIDLERNYQLAIHGSSDFYNLVSPSQAQRDQGLCQSLTDTDQPLRLKVKDIAGNEVSTEIPVRRTISTVANKPDYARLAALLQRYGDHVYDITYAFIPDGERLCLLVRWSANKQATFLVTQSPTASSADLLKDIGGGYWLGVVDSPGGLRLLDREGSLRLTRSAAGGSDAKEEYTLNSGYQRVRIGSQTSDDAIESADQQLRVSFPDGENSFLPLDRQFYFKVQQGKSLRGVDYTILPNDFPLAKQANVTYRFGKTVPRGAGLYLGEGERPNFLGSQIDTSARTVVAKSYKLGTISMQIDTLLPTIREVTPTANATVTSARPQIRCRIGDNLSGIRDSMAVHIDGRWCIPVFDPEEGTLIASPHFDLLPGIHQLKITVTDRVGNTRVYSSEFKFGTVKKASGSKQKRGK